MNCDVDVVMFAVFLISRVGKQGSAFSGKAGRAYSYVVKHAGVQVKSTEQRYLLGVMVVS